MRSGHRTVDVASAMPSTARYLRLAETATCASDEHDEVLEVELCHSVWFALDRFWKSNWWLL